ncbi:MAG: amidohydrolase [Flavobacterium sp.]|nr:MAG: amidohydrolase [Flavobacterium sp.]
MKSILKITIFFIGFFAIAQQTPAPIQSEVITIVGATAHIGNGTVIENSVIIFENGKITAIGDENKTPVKDQGQVIYAKGKHIYPGFIAPNTTLGLVEIDAVRPTRDQDELGDMIPNVRSLIAYNAESKVVESMRPNGVLIGQITPRGGTISGTSSIVQFDAWNWEDAAVKVDDGIHLHWPSSYSQGRWWLGESSAYKPNKKYQERINKIKSFILNSKSYGKATPKTQNESFKAMQGLFNGSQKMYVYADSEKEIIDAVTTLKELGINQLVLVGAYEAYKIANFLKTNTISVLIQRVHTTPDGDDEDYDLPYKLAKLLVDAGVLVALQTSGQMSGMNTRNLPFYAGQVAAQGLDKEIALQLITLNAAKILGIDSDYGTLEVGKSATLFISEGDALDMRTNILIKAFIDGRDISLETHQTELWNRYSEKFNNK